MSDNLQRNDYGDNNPYAPPRGDTPSTEPIAALPVNGGATIRILYTADFLIEALTRYRAQRAGRWAYAVATYLAPVVFTFIAAIAIWQNRIGFALILIVLIILFTSNQLSSNRNTRRAFASSPHCNEELTLHITDAGFDSQSEIQQTRLQWSVFKRVVYFDDGYLLFQGPTVFNWLPNSAFVDGTNFNEFESLLRSKISQHDDRRKRTL